MLTAVSIITVRQSIQSEPRNLPHAPAILAKIASRFGVGYFVQSVTEHGHFLSALSFSRLCCPPPASFGLDPVGIKAADCYVMCSSHSVVTCLQAAILRTNCTCQTSEEVCWIFGFHRLNVEHAIERMAFSHLSSGRWEKE